MSERGVRAARCRTGPGRPRRRARRGRPPARRRGPRRPDRRRGDARRRSRRRRRSCSRPRRPRSPLHDPATDRLVFVAAAGPAAGDVVGLAIDSAAGHRRLRVHDRPAARGRRRRRGPAFRPDGRRGDRLRPALPAGHAARRRRGDRRRPRGARPRRRVVHAARPRDARPRSRAQATLAVRAGRAQRDGGRLLRVAP